MSSSWERIYARRLRFSDAVLVIFSVFLSQMLFVPAQTQLEIKGFTGLYSFGYVYLSLFFVGMWLLFLNIFSTYSKRIVGAGNTEYRAVFQASLTFFALIAFLSFLLQAEISRLYFVISFVLGVFLVSISRWLWRKWLSGKRKSNQLSDSAFLIGSSQSVVDIQSALASHPEAGLVIYGTLVIDDKATSSTAKSAAALVKKILNELKLSGATHLIIGSSDALSPYVVKELSWELDTSEHELIVVPSIIGVGGPRIHSRPVAGLPLILIETPEFEGNGPFSKRALDVIFSAFLLVILSPVFLIVALGIKLTSKGPVLYRQERVGIDGKSFYIYKFRSMKVGADAELEQLLQDEGKGDTPFFKVENDPRLIPIGSFIRKYSLDELPQLLNVLGGSMSIVGPRPQRPAEVELYDHVAARRLLVKPGMTGLWQVSGRSTLSWEESIRLDLYYVENWTLSADFLILARTAQAVLKPGKTAL